jgi:alkanesulfonate monooxygenase SsuD/methylene tetrahydromethanopterin reductase-like flavin-dependent oxidoreductase (luciferase family)
MPPGYNHPARVAERVATLDLVSHGRVELGTGESASRMELGGFNVSPEQKRAMWLESVEQVANMMAMDPYPGFEGEFFSMPCRNVVPKPVQKPHPPLWVACSSRETIHLAAQLGLGALTFAFVDPSDAKKWVDDYYETLERECIPIGHAINPNVAMVTGFSLHQDAGEAARRGLDGFRFFGYALAHYYIYGHHQPGRTDIWKSYEAIKGNLPADGQSHGIGTTDQMRAHLRGFADAGVDQVVFIQQGGKNRHEHICESLERFAADVMPEWKEHAAEREAEKMERLGPALERAMARKRWMRPLADSEIPVYEPLGRAPAETSDPRERERRERARELREALEKIEAAR